MTIEKNEGRSWPKEALQEHAYHKSIKAGDRVVVTTLGDYYACQGEVIEVVAGGLNVKWDCPDKMKDVEQTVITGVRKLSDFNKLASQPETHFNEQVSVTFDYSEQFRKTGNADRESVFQVWLRDDGGLSVTVQGQDHAQQILLEPFNVCHVVIHGVRDAINQGDGN